MLKGRVKKRKAPKKSNLRFGWVGLLGAFIAFYLWCALNG